MSKAITSPPLRCPTVDEYAAAFRVIASKVNDKQRELLRLHHSAPGQVATSRDLAQAAGYKDYGAANLQYGKLGGLLREALAIADGRLKCSILVIMVPPNTATNSEWLWIMRPQVREALERIGWLPPTLDILFPQGPDNPGGD